MLYVYDNIGKVPEGKRIIEDVEAWFRSPGSRSKAVDVILRDIEHGSYHNEQCFTDRFGNQLYWSFLSTGAKAAILTVTREDYVVSLRESGDNVYECLFANGLSGSVLVPSVGILPFFWNV